MHLSFAGEYDHAYAVVGEPLQELPYGMLGPLYARGLHVVGRHRVGDVDDKHHLAPLDLHFAKARAYLRPCGGNDDKPQSGAQHTRLDPFAQGRAVGHQRSERRAVAEARQTARLGPLRQPEYEQYQRYGRKSVQPLGFGESKHYGILLKIKLLKNNSTARSSRASTIQRPKSSVYRVLCTTSTLLFSKVSI